MQSAQTRCSIAISWSSRQGSGRTSSLPFGPASRWTGESSWVTTLPAGPPPTYYAVGECAQHRGRMYGLVAPLWEQTQVLADRLTRRNADAVYQGSSTSTKLKVAGVDLAVMGEREPLEEDDEVVSYSEPSRGIYKKLIVRNNRLAGAIVMGDGAIVPGLIQAFRESRPIIDSRAHLLFPVASERAAAPPVPDQIPDSAQICDCNAVTKADIVEAVLSGARTLSAISDATRACTGCGTCRPQVQAILDFASSRRPSRCRLASPQTF